MIVDTSTMPLPPSSEANRQPAPRTAAAGRPACACSTTAESETRAISRASVRADHFAYGPEQQLQIEPQRAAVDVFHVEAQPLVHVRATARDHLPEASHPGHDVESRGLPQLVGLGTERCRPWADPRH